MLTQQVRPTVQRPATLGRGTGSHATPPRSPMPLLPGDTSERHRASHGLACSYNNSSANPAPCEGADPEEDGEREAVTSQGSSARQKEIGQNKPTGETDTVVRSASASGREEK